MLGGNINNNASLFMQDKALLVCYNFPLFVAPYLMWEPESLVCSGQLGVSRQGRFPAHALKLKKILQLINFFYYAEGLDSESEIRNPQKKLCPHPGSSRQKKHRILDPARWPGPKILRTSHKMGQFPFKLSLISLLSVSNLKAARSPEEAFSEKFQSS